MQCHILLLRWGVASYNDLYNSWIIRTGSYQETSNEEVVPTWLKKCWLQLHKQTMHGSRKFYQMGSNFDVLGGGGGGGFSWWVEGGYKLATIGLPAKRHLNGVLMAGLWWPNIEYWLGSFVIFQGIWTRIAKKSYIFCDQTPRPPPPPLHPSLQTFEICSKILWTAWLIYCKFKIFGEGLTFEKRKVSWK